MRDAYGHRVGRRRQAVLLAGAFLVCLGSAVRAEYAIGLGNIEKPTKDASAKVNDALGEFHKMLAALDRQQADSVPQHRKAVLDLLRAAANLYEGIKADQQRQLKPLPQTQQEREFVDYFQAHAAEFGVKLPATQFDLIQASSRLLRDFYTRVDKTPLSKTEEAQQLANYSANLQKFLISVTTVLIITN